MSSNSSSYHMSEACSTYLFHHIFLPPKLPQSNDYDFSYEIVLIDNLICALQEFREYVQDQQLGVVDAILVMVTRLRKISNSGGDINEAMLRNSFTELETKGGHLVIHVKAQNSGILLTHNGAAINVEAVELSPRNEAVITTLGRLRRQFPGPCFALDQATFNESRFKDSLANTIATLSYQSAAGTKAKVKKAKQCHDEPRDSTKPKMIMEFLLSFIRPRCAVVESLQINKNTREEVLWHNSFAPWKRSPLWLLLRLSMQLLMTRECRNRGVSDDIYKQFMIYFMCYIADRCSREMPSESYYAMNSKISRRLLKLALPYEPGWLSFARDILTRGHEFIRSRWESKLVENSDNATQVLSELTFSEDVYCNLLHVDQYIIERLQSSGRGVQDERQPHLPSSPRAFNAATLPGQLGARSSSEMYELIAFQDWVEWHLEGWLQLNIGQDNTCCRLGKLMRNYYEFAQKLSSKNPEDASIMLLTILELWIACDKSAVNLHPILEDYDPDIPIEVFQSLLLRSLLEMKRLSRAEDYLHQRKQRAIYPGSAVFQSFGLESSFAVRYFDLSPGMQTIRDKIQRSADAQRAAKLQEFHHKRQLHHELSQRASGMVCTYVDVVVDKMLGTKESRHSGSCTRCDLMKQAESINIKIHEWPLPRDALEAKTVIFELQLPRAFGSWRDTTIFFLLSVLKLEYHKVQNPRAEFRPSSHSGLASYSSQANNVGRIGLLSQIKPHEVTHRKVKHIMEVSENDVCLENGTKFQYYDKGTGCFVEDFKITQKVATLCTYRLPMSSSALQKFIFRPAESADGLSPNSVIASLDTCPEGFSLEEYKSMCTMPLGIEIQWPNILSQLSMPTVIFRKTETCLIILQMINQTGPLNASSSLRKAHNILREPRFVGATLHQIQNAVQRIEENWESAQELSILIAIVQKILSLSDKEKVHTDCLIMLHGMRSIALKWIHIIAEKIALTPEEDERNSLIGRSVQLALICVGTFDSDPDVLRRILEHDSDASILLQCSILIHDRAHMLPMEANPLLPILYNRWKHISNRCLTLLSYNIVQREKAALDLAVKESWAAYQKGSPWSVVSGDGEYWLESSAECEDNKITGIPVHFNLLTGELLVNYVPLARLPSDYEAHETYRRLFGKSLLEVMPSNAPGMQFSSQRLHFGHAVHLGRIQIAGSIAFDLCVRSIAGGRTYEFIPRRLLTGLLPDTFVDDFTHWYDIESGVVELRPRDATWKHSVKSHPRLYRDSARGQWCLQKGSNRVINIKSRTSKALSRILGPIEEASKMYYSVHASVVQLDIELPRLRLSFSLSQGSQRIESKQYRGMFIDPDQSVGTLVGLREKLILVNDDQKERLVLVPEGDVSWRKDGYHVSVKIGWQPVTTFHSYSVDTQLGQLQDNGSLESKFFLCYLHALTSSCLPDPLTQKTGTEQALSILDSAAVKSFDHLTQDNYKILGKIASLTPSRRYYPANERVMESVRWDENLGFLAQHGSFYLKVGNIFEHDRRMAVFRPESKVDEPPLPHMSDDLLLRHRGRSSTFRLSGFGAEDHTVKRDSIYTDVCNYDSTQSLRVYRICKILYEDIPLARNLKGHEVVEHIWKFLLRSPTLNGPGSEIKTSELRYDAQWIIDPNDFVSRSWCSLHHVVCSRKNRFDKFQLMTWLSSLAFSEACDMIVLEFLASMYIVPKMSAFSPPRRKCFQPGQGHDMDRTELRSGIQSAACRSETPESNLVRPKDESSKNFKSRVKRERARNRAIALDHFVDALKKQWPCRAPSKPCLNGTPKFEDYFKSNKAMSVANAHFSHWFDNREFFLYLMDLSNVLAGQPAQVLESPSCPPIPGVEAETRWPGFVRSGELFARTPILNEDVPRLRDLLHTSTVDEGVASAVADLVQKLGSYAQSTYQRVYVDQLRESARSLERTRRAIHLNADASELRLVLSKYLSSCKTYSERVYSEINSCMMTPRGDAETNNFRCQVIEILATIGQVPRLSPIFLLQQLTRRKWDSLSEGWKHSIIAYGCSITALQRAMRLYSLVDKPDDLTKELQEPGHTNWQPNDFPEYLLLEIESNILIRKVQEEIAQQMRDCPSGQNFVMQLNMGEGKSSVITPMVALSCADGTKTVCIITPKPQSRQMMQMLVSKLGGLLNRRVYHIPISRSLRLGKEEADDIHRMCQECMSEGGVILAQPEHILSLRLMCFEYFHNGNNVTGNSLFKILDFLRSSSRDLVDESDENFSVKFELIYTIGMQRALELSPERWIIIQKVLGLVQKHALPLKQSHPHSIEVVDRCSGSFPRIRILDSDIGELLFHAVATEICDSGIDFLPLSRQPQQVREAARTYVLSSKLTAAEIAAIENNDPTSLWNDNTKGPLLLVRGLLAGGILQFCFSRKRWRVNYGLDPRRKQPTRLAVPYRAKDNPAPRSEFSHPDVLIVLTSLSYYYGGLQDDDLFLAFHHLVDLDQADMEYQAWVADAPGLPYAYHQLAGVNLEDRNHCVEHIFPNLRFAKAVIDYFLAYIVFPKELKQYPEKLSASGWDTGEIKAHSTVGFSGTNDSRVTLPLSVQQLDLPRQNHTNALVLEHLLQSENSVSFIPPQTNPSIPDALIILDMVSKLHPPTQVILDVGAQILELNNLDVATSWLEMIPDDGRIQAVIFVNDNDEICVVDRSGRVEQLQCSSFATQLHACYVFLDEAHTRGIDLKLPQHYRAAVTLGAGITKDKLVQACMRMRKLGNGQTISFCIPREIAGKILSLTGKQSERDITISDIISWAVSETWLDMRRSMPLWAIQGKRFSWQQYLLQDTGYPIYRTALTPSRAAEFLEPESQTLDHRYRPGPKLDLGPMIEETGDENVEIMQRCREFENLIFDAAQLEEEQERELAPEVEQERQVEKPMPAAPRVHFLHPDLVLFVSMGELNMSSPAFKPAFEILKKTSAAHHLDLSQFPPGLLVTKDFAKTVKARKECRGLDDYQRPVQWILTRSSPDSTTGSMVVRDMIIISPYEAFKLYSIVQISKFVVMHLYAPRQNQGFQALDKLHLYNVPPSTGSFEIPTSLRIQLNLFAGQLYIRSYEEYVEICDFLGIASMKTPEGISVAADGFIVGGSRPSTTSFTQSPLKFLKALMSQIRKNCQNIDKTHIGKIIDGKILDTCEFAQARED